MSLLDPVKEWLFKVALRKGIARAVTFLVAFVTSAKVAPLLMQWGIMVDPVVLEASLTAFFIGAFEMLRNWLKVKFGLKFL